MSRKNTTFKRNEEYNTMKSRGILPVDEASVAEVLSSVPAEVAVPEMVEKGINLLFQQLFMVSLDEVPLSSLGDAFKEYASEVKAMEADDKVAVIRAIDFFVGRQRQDGGHRC
jgi:hypothetical protein